VERLKPSNVVIVDDRGRDLTAILDDDDDFKGISEKQLKIVSEFEKKLERKILKALSETLGYDRVKVVVSAEMDFTKMEKREELYDPDMTAVVSQQKKKERTTGTGVAGIPGATANIPPGAGAGGGGTINTEKSEVITNFEVSKKEIYTADYAPKQVLIWKVCFYVSACLYSFHYPDEEAGKKREGYSRSSSYTYKGADGW